MNSKKKKYVYSKIKIINFVVVLFLLLSGCAVPFQNGETLERGESEGILGYTPLNNLSVIYNWGLTGYTDIGFGLELPIPFMLHTMVFASGKQKLLAFDLSNDNRLNILASGSIGAVLAENETPTYYQCNGMVGFKDSTTLLTIGGGILKDPRYSYDFMGNSFRDEVFRHIFIGFKENHFMIQMQFIFRGEYDDNILNFGIAYCK